MHQDVADADGLGSSGSSSGRCGFDVVAMGVNDPLNIGSIFRLMGCFGASAFTHCHIGRRRPEARDWQRERASAAGRSCDGEGDGGCAGVDATDAHLTRTGLVVEHVTVVSAQLKERVRGCETQMESLAAEVVSLRDGIESAQRRADALGRTMHKKGSVLAKEFWRGGNNASAAFWKLPAIEAEVRRTARGMERQYSPFVSKHVTEFIEVDMAAKGRPPLVVIETATGAVSLRAHRLLFLISVASVSCACHTHTH